MTADFTAPSQLLLLVALPFAVLHTATIASLFTDSLVTFYTFLSGPPGIPVLKVENSPPLRAKIPVI